MAAIIIPGQSGTYRHLQGRITDLLAESGLNCDFALGSSHRFMQYPVLMCLRCPCQLGLPENLTTQQLGNSRGLSLARRTCHSSAVHGADPLRSLPKPQQRRIHFAVILGRPVPPHQAAVAAGHARHLRWVSVVGGIIAVISVGMLVATAFAPYAKWSMWLTPATLLVCGATFLFLGFNARRAARVYHRPRG